MKRNSGFAARGYSNPKYFRDTLYMSYIRRISSAACL